VTTSNNAAAVVRQNEGRVLHAFGEVIIHLDGERTDGKLTMWTEVTNFAQTFTQS